MCPTYLTGKQISFSQKLMSITLTAVSTVHIGGGREVIFIRVDLSLGPPWEILQGEDRGAVYVGAYWIIVIKVKVQWEGR